MAFSSRELSVLAYANGFTLWHYRSGDSADEVLVPGYFLAADELFRSGDLVLLTLTGSGRPFGAALVVTAVRPGLSVEVTAAGWPAAPGLQSSCERDAAAKRRMAAAC